MPKPVKLISMFLCLALVLTGTLWLGYVHRGKARNIEVTVSLLPIAHWGFGASDTVQAAEFRTHAGKMEKPHDVKRTVGFIEIRERHWLPLTLNPPSP